MQKKNTYRERSVMDIANYAATLLMDATCSCCNDTNTPTHTHIGTHKAAHTAAGGSLQADIQFNLDTCSSFHHVSCKYIVFTFNSHLISQFTHFQQNFFPTSMKKKPKETCRKLMAQVHSLLLFSFRFFY